MVNPLAWVCVIDCHIMPRGSISNGNFFFFFLGGGGGGKLEVLGENRTLN